MSEEHTISVKTDNYVKGRVAAICQTVTILNEELAKSPNGTVNMSMYIGDVVLLLNIIKELSNETTRRLDGSTAIHQASS